MLFALHISCSTSHSFPVLFFPALLFSDSFFWLRMLFKLLSRWVRARNRWTEPFTERGPIQVFDKHWKSSRSFAGVTFAKVLQPFSLFFVDSFRPSSSFFVVIYLRLLPLLFRIASFVSVDRLFCPCFQADQVKTHPFNYEYDILCPRHGILSRPVLVTGLVFSWRHQEIRCFAISTAGRSSSFRLLFRLDDSFVQNLFIYLRSLLSPSIVLLGDH